MNEKLLCNVTNTNGVPFNVTLRTGDKHPCLAFYDDRFHGSPAWVEFGQFVASYRAKTLTDDWHALMDNGLCLNGGVPAWFVTGDNMRTVFGKLLSETF